LHSTLSTQQPAAGRRPIPDLRPGERLVLIQRQHPAVLFRSLLKPVIMLAVWTASLFFVLPFISSLQPDPLTSLSPQGPPSWLPTALWFGWLGLAVVLVLWGAYLALDWSDDWIALTNRRLIIMDKTLFLRESRREAPIGRVQNVTAEYPNSMAVALDYGDLKVDTAGIGVLLFRNLPRPRRMREAIFNVQADEHAAQPSPEDLRKARARSIILGTDPAMHDRPTPPHGISTTEQRPPNAESQYSTRRSVWSLLFPLSPQRDQESVTWHKHWIYLLRGVFPQLLLSVLLIGAWFASISLGEQGQYGPLPVILGWAAVVIVPISLLWALWNWEDWRNDFYRLDHERIHDIERLPLGLREQSKETLVTRVADVTYLVPGPLAHLLNYGDVTLKTPGESTEFNFKGVPHPREVQQEIMDRINEYRQKGNASTEREIEAWLRAYHDAQHRT
jgi:hypothetical protein